MNLKQHLIYCVPIQNPNDKSFYTSFKPMLGQILPYEEENNQVMGDTTRLWLSNYIFYVLVLLGPTTLQWFC